MNLNEIMVPNLSLLMNLYLKYLIMYDKNISQSLVGYYSTSFEKVASKSWLLSINILFIIPKFLDFSNATQKKSKSISRFSWSL